MKIDWADIKARLREAVLILPNFFKNPVQGMRNLPHWDWPTMLILQGILAAVTTVLAQVIGRDYIGAVVGIVIAPITSYLILFIGSGFFYYLFMFFFQREIPYRQIYTHLLFASVPAALVSILTSFVPPVILLGLIATCLLLYVGFVDNFHLDRRKVRNVLIGLMIGYIVFWIFQIIRMTSRHDSMRLKATPESLDILEKELNPDADK